MKTIAIICELNPLHNGHAYLINEAKKSFGADRVILIMSGDFTQRGTPAIVPKEVRTKMALTAGADVVIELPVCYATGSAEYFAFGAISICNTLNCVDAILFGSECGNIKLLQQIARILSSENILFSEELQKAMKAGKNFAAARDIALRKVLSVSNELDLVKDLEISPSVLISPNNILGIEYCKSLIQTHSKIQPLTTKRLGAAYHDSLPNDPKTSDNSINNNSSFFASATGIRELLENSHRQGEKTEDFLSKETLLLLQNSMPPEVFKQLVSEKEYRTMNDFSMLLRYKLTCLSDRNLLTGFFDVHTDLADKIIKNLPNFTDIDSFSLLLKSKDLTYTRISRCLLHILLDIYEKDMRTLKEHNYPSYIRLLGFRKESSDVLSVMKKSSFSPIISRMSDANHILDEEHKFILHLDVKASDIYHLLDKEKEPLNEYQKKIIIF